MAKRGRVVYGKRRRQPGTTPLASSRQRGESALIEALCRVVREYLEKQAEQLSEEVRNYPTPIARCDEQLTALLERRAGTLLQLQRLSSLGDEELSRAECIALTGKLIDLFLDRRDA